jgi:HEAT repeat protein
LSDNNDIDKTIDQLQKGDRETRKSAAIKLGRIRDPKSIPFLLKAIREDTYQMTRVFAIQSLTWIADKSVIPDLLEVIRGDQDDLVRQTAIEAMVGFNSRESLDTLYEVVYDLRNTDKIKTAASQAIGKIRGYTN